MHNPAPPEPSPPPSISVIIPTYNRVQLLLECLRHLEAQTAQNFEVLVVDDGSTDNTGARMEEYKRTATFPLRYLHQANAGPARARNKGISNVASPICLFMGDDIFPAPIFVQTHLQFHLDHPEPQAVALGYTRWSERNQTVTPLMRWLDAEGMQFGYRELLNGSPPTWKHFYTSNLSVKTALLGDKPFYEGFHNAGMEDIELGYRLSKNHGLKMSFLPEAVAEHLHPTTLDDSCSRAAKVGAAEYYFQQLWPELRPPPLHPVKRAGLFLFSQPKLLLLPAFTVLAKLLTRLWFSETIVRRVLQFHRIAGYRQAAAAQHSGRPRLSEPVC